MRVYFISGWIIPPVETEKKMAIEALFEQIKAINESTVLIPMSEVKFYPELRSLCESNVCGGFGGNYTCPPYIGPVEDLIATLKQFKTLILFRHVYTLEDSFDIEGMEEGSRLFRELSQQVLTLTKEEEPDGLVLSAGGCRLCDTCGIKSGTPCCFPDRALSSLEAHGLQVSELAKTAGVPYISGTNTVTYFGGVFLK